MSRRTRGRGRAERRGRRGSPSGFPRGQCRQRPSGERPRDARPHRLREPPGRAQPYDIPLRALLADALIFYGTIHHLSGAYLESKKLIEEGLVYARETNDTWFAAYGVYNIGHVDSILGDYEKGYEQMQAGLKLLR
mgnify:CR=1 FL=1